MRHDPLLVAKLQLFYEKCEKRRMKYAKTCLFLTLLENLSFVPYQQDHSHCQ